MLFIVSALGERFAMPSIKVLASVWACFHAVMLALPASAGTLYHCKQANGAKAYQDRPCETQTIKVEEVGVSASKQMTEELVRTLAKASGKSEQELMRDPKKRQAVEALVAVDFIKAYAATQLYGVSAEFCGAPVAGGLEAYRRAASESIALGRHYLAAGIHVEAGDKSINMSSKQINDSIEAEVKKRRSSLQSKLGSSLERECKEAVEALSKLTELYRL